MWDVIPWCGKHYMCMAHSKFPGFINGTIIDCAAVTVLSEGDGPKVVTGCILTTPKMDIRVDQVSGYEQAALHPDTEAWAAPFTW